MMAGVAERSDREGEAAQLEAELAKVCGVLNAATGALVGLIEKALDTGAYAGAGVRSPEQWVAWKCGLSSTRARKLLSMARRLPELSHCRVALEAGELSEDQVAVVCRHAPAWADAEVTTLAKEATVAQLARTLRRYAFSPTADDDENEEEPRRVSFGGTEEGNWRLSATLPPDEGAVVTKALEAQRRLLAQDGSEPSWADALVAMAEATLAAGAAGRAHGDGHVVVVHLRAEDHGPSAQVHLGQALPDALRRLVGCDARVRTLVEVGHKPVSVGRSFRIVAERTRMAVEDRDGGCRVPGCERARWLQIHHVVHWEDGGATDTANLVALCSTHHRLHHLGRLGIEGDADEPDGLVFTDRRGRRLTGCGRPAPPGQLGIAGTWVPPSGERLDTRWVYFNEPRPPAS